MDDRKAMLLDWVNDQDQRVGSIIRADVFKRHANFRVVHVLLLSPQGELLLQKIGSKHPRHPNYWGSSVAGYVKAGETYKAAACRKLLEELGIKDVPLKYLGKTSMIDEGVKKFISVYTVTYAGMLAPNPEDFAAMEFVPLSRLRTRKVKHRLTPTFEHVLHFLFTKLPAAQGG